MARNDVLQGVEHFRKGRLDKAERCFRKALDEDPGNLAAKNNLAIAMAENKKGKEAASMMKKTLKECDHERGYYATIKRNLTTLSKKKEKPEKEETGLDKKK